jgi:hypothetical protein
MKLPRSLAVFSCPSVGQVPDSNDPVIRFRGEDATKQFTQAKKPFSRLLEDGLKR